jgi:hypothetical protein
MIEKLSKWSKMLIRDKEYFSKSVKSFSTFLDTGPQEFPS